MWLLLIVYLGLMTFVGKGCSSREPWSRPSYDIECSAGTWLGKCWASGHPSCRVKGDGTAAELSVVVERGKTVGRCVTKRNGEKDGVARFFVRVWAIAHRDGHRLELAMTKTEMVGC